MSDRCFARRSDALAQRLVARNRAGRPRRLPDRSSCLRLTMRSLVSRSGRLLDPRERAVQRRGCADKVREDESATGHAGH